MRKWQDIAQGTTIHVSTKPLVESTAEFRDGICCGYLTYYDEHADKLLASSNEYHFLMQNIIDVRGTDQFNAG
jgi:hypothetical protein